jgi:hypothetical protein
MIEKGEIGFDRRLKLPWLDFTADLVAQGQPAAEIRQALSRHLEGVLAESGTRGARSKTITVLCRLWCDDGSAVDPLRHDAIRLRQDVPRKEAVWLHTGLAIATYPFFLSTMETLGRLLRLQQDVSLQEATRRVCEQWGDRERVARSARHVIQTVRDWGLLGTTPKKGVYAAPEPRPLPHIELGIWLLRTLLVGARRTMAPLAEITGSPAIYPFLLSPLTPHLLRQSEKIRLIRHGLDDDLIGLVDS